MDDGSRGGAAWPAQQIPQGMMRVMADEFGRFYTHEAGEMFAAKALQFRRNETAGGQQVPAEEARDRPLVRFRRGLFRRGAELPPGAAHAHSQLPEQMATCIAQSKTMPASEDNKLFSDHVTLAGDAPTSSTPLRGCAELCVRVPGRQRHRPHSLAKLLDIPVLHVTIGRFPNSSSRRLA
jgi:hypothetical protein